MDGNKISKLEANAFKGVRTYKIDLSNNQIGYIHADAFKGLEGDLEEIILVHNNLQQVPEALFTMHMMRTLDLSFNHIGSYSPENVKEMKAWRVEWAHNGTHWYPTERRKGIQLRIGANPLVCDKEMCALRQWIPEESWNFVDTEDINCAVPNTPFFPKKLMDVDPYDLGCDVRVAEDLKTQLEQALTAKHTMAGLFAFAFLVCLALGAYLFYVRRYKMKASPIPVQFKNPLSSAKQKSSDNNNNNDHRVLVDGDSKRANAYEQVNTGKMDPPVISNTFDDLGNIYDNI